MVLQMYLVYGVHSLRNFYRSTSQQMGKVGILFPIYPCFQQIAISLSLQEIMFATLSRRLYKAFFRFIQWVFTGLVVVGVFFFLF